MCPVLHKLQGDGVCRDGALVKGHASEFVDGSPHLAARVREDDGVYCFLPSPLLLLPEPRKEERSDSIRVSLHWARVKE